MSRKLLITATSALVGLYLLYRYSRAPAALPGSQPKTWASSGGADLTTMTGIGAPGVPFRTVKSITAPAGAGTGWSYRSTPAGVLTPATSNPARGTGGYGPIS